MATVTLEEYESAREEYLGWCKECQDWTGTEVEPDACGYECPQCEQPTVYGAEEALICGHLKIAED